MKSFITIVLMLGILLISVSSFASTDGGLLLKNWYDLAIGYAVEEAAADFLTEVIGLEQIIDVENREQTADANGEVGILSSRISENSIKEVLNYQRHYIMKVDKSEQALKKKNLSALKYEETENLESELEADAAEILSDILQ